jgi:hypothetical protein
VLLPLVSNLQLQIALQVGRDPIVVEKRVINVEQECDALSRCHRQRF